jgi:hypothetical protein
VAISVASATGRRAAIDELVARGFVYPDALDIRTDVFRGNSAAPVRGTASEMSSALPCLTPDPGPENEQPASVAVSHSPGADRAPAGGAS